MADQISAGTRLISTLITLTKEPIDSQEYQNVLFVPNIDGNIQKKFKVCIHALEPPLVQVLLLPLKY